MTAIRFAARASPSVSTRQRRFSHTFAANEFPIILLYSVDVLVRLATSSAYSCVSVGVAPEDAYSSATMRVRFAQRNLRRLRVE